MNWYRNLYTGKTAEKKKEKLIQEIENEIYRGNTYLITLAANPQNNLEIFSVHQLRFSYIRKNCPTILGLASGWDEVLEVFQKMADEVYLATGDVKIREYFERSVDATQDTNTVSQHGAGIGADSEKAEFDV